VRAQSIIIAAFMRHWINRAAFTEDAGPGRLAELGRMFGMMADEHLQECDDEVLPGLCEPVGAAGSHFHCVRSSFAEGMQPGTRIAEGFTAVYGAAQNGRKSIVPFLLGCEGRGFDGPVSGDDGTPLYMAWLLPDFDSLKEVATDQAAIQSFKVETIVVINIRNQNRDRSPTFAVERA
jgi:hypothetical protein